MILMLCSPSEVWKERRGYLRAFERRGESVVFVGPATECEPGMRPDTDIDRIIERVGQPTLILHPDGSVILPQGIARAAHRTACFHIDTQRVIDHRVAWAMLFDYTFVFQPGFEDAYRRAGHPHVFLHPHAVEADLFEESLPEGERIYDLGWVGSIGRERYSCRNRLIPALAERFVTNDWRRQHTPEEMAHVYKQSKVVVNVGGDEFLEAANLRCFEAMAAGALLITKYSGALEKIGFRQGEHYVAYRHEDEVEGIVRRYLERESGRRRITTQARDLVLKEHTYDRRVEEILKAVDADPQPAAPARRWLEEDVARVYIDFFAHHDALDPALSVLKELRCLRRAAAWRATPPLLQSLRRSLRTAL